MVAPYIILLLCYIVVPVVIAHFAMRGAWTDILTAYGIWFALLAFLGFAHGGSHGEGYAWMTLIAMFSTFIAVPVIVLLIKVKRRIVRGA